MTYKISGRFGAARGQSPYQHFKFGGEHALEAVSVLETITIHSTQATIAGGAHATRAMLVSRMLYNSAASTIQPKRNKIT